MPTITPPPPPTTQATMPPPAPVIVVQNPPATITQLNIGHVLDAAIAAQVGKDMYTLKTPLGQLTVQTTLPLPKLAKLVLHLQSLTPQAQFIINTINGKAPPGSPRPGAKATSQMQSASPGNATAQTVPKTAGTVSLKAGTTLQASLLRPLAQPSTGRAQAAAIAAASTLKTEAGTAPQTTVAEGLQKSIVKGFGKLAARALSATQGAKTAAAPGTAARVKTAGANPANASQATQTAAKGGNYLSAGSHFSVKIGKIVLPSAVATDATQPPARPAGGGLAIGRTLTGIVTATTESGNPVLQTSSGVLALKTQVPLPRGSVVTLDITSTPVPPKTDPSFHLGGERKSLFLSRSWPALEESIVTIHDAAPAAAQQLAQNVIPRPGPALTATVMFFLSALRGGDLRSWLGEPQIRTIERTRPNLLGRLNDDFQTLGRIADEPAGDWRVALIPVNTGEKLEQIRMLMRHGGEEEEDEADESKTRFIIDVVLTRMGRVQLDGLVRGNGKKLDLILRSETPLAKNMHEDIQKIFRNASETSGLTGGVSFQATPPNFIEIDDPTSNGEMGLIV